MRIERRIRLQADHVTRKVAAVLISESAEESKILDELFGSELRDADGLIARRVVECRLSDGFAEHYLYVSPDEVPA